MADKDMRSVLVLSDLTETTDRALGTAATIAAHIGARLDVIHAVAVIGQPLSEALHSLHDLRRRVDSTDAGLRRQIRRVCPPGTRAQRVIAYHGALDAIVRRVRSVRVDLVVLSGGWSWDLTGRDASALSLNVIELIRTPCLVLNGALAPGAGRTVVAAGLDGERSDAVAHAREWAEVLRGSVGSGGPPTAELSRHELVSIDVSPARAARTLLPVGMSAGLFTPAVTTRHPFSIEAEADGLRALVNRTDVDLFAVALSAGLDTALTGACERLCPTLLSNASAPILFLPSRRRYPPPRPGSSASRADEELVGAGVGTG